MALTVSPSLAYKLSDKVSVGASVNANYGFLSLTRDVNGEDKRKKITTGRRAIASAC